MTRRNRQSTERSNQWQSEWTINQGNGLEMHLLNSVPLFGPNNLGPQVCRALSPCGPDSPRCKIWGVALLLVETIECALSRQTLLPLVWPVKPETKADRPTPTTGKDQPDNNIFTRETKDTLHIVSIWTTRFFQDGQKANVKMSLWRHSSKLGCHFKTFGDASWWWGAA